LIQYPLRARRHPQAYRRCPGRGPE